MAPCCPNGNGLARWDHPHRCVWITLYDFFKLFELKNFRERERASLNFAIPFHNLTVSRQIGDLQLFGGWKNHILIPCCCWKTIPEKYSALSRVWQAAGSAIDRPTLPGTFLLLDLLRVTPEPNDGHRGIAMIQALNWCSSFVEFTICLCYNLCYRICNSPMMARLITERCQVHEWGIWLVRISHVRFFGFVQRRLRKFYALFLWCICLSLW